MYVCMYVCIYFKNAESILHINIKYYYKTI